jgi:hypothetical protein
MACCGSKNDFCKKPGACLIAAKVQSHPGFSEIGRSLRKIKNIPLKVSKYKMHVANDDMDVIFRFMLFFDQFRYIIYQILIYGFVNMDYLILNEKRK